MPGSPGNQAGLTAAPTLDDQPRDVAAALGPADAPGGAGPAEELPAPDGPGVDAPGTAPGQVVPAVAGRRRGKHRRQGRWATRRRPAG